MHYCILCLAKGKGLFDLICILELEGDEGFFGVLPCVWLRQKIEEGWATCEDQKCYPSFEDQELHCVQLAKEGSVE